MTETTDPQHLSEQDEVDLALLAGEEFSADDTITHTLLEIWQRLLTDAEAERELKPSAVFANRVVGSWPKLAFQDVPAYYRLYHDKLIEFRDLLNTEIAKDNKAFSYTGEDDDSDAVGNRERYIELLFLWQERIQNWELDWDAGDYDSHISIAAIADASAFIFGSQGLVAHLDRIGLRYNEEDRETLQQRLIESREARDDR